MKYLVSFRSTLNLCNYECGYCPWAGTFEKTNPVKVAEDAKKIEKMVNRFLEVSADFSLFLVPRGEFLILPHYREAVGILTKQKHIQDITIQTNLSFRLELLLDQVDSRKIRLWTTFHPDQVPENHYEELLKKYHFLREQKVPFSVGVVGIKENFSAIEKLRNEVSKDIYIWVNAYKRVPNYYNKEDLEFLSRIDPFFKTHAIRYISYGRVCKSGEDRFFLEESGQMKRCNFTEETIGNFYEEHWEDALKPRRCPLAECSCYQGLMHIPELNFESIYGNFAPARIPLAFQPQELISQGAMGRREDI